MSSLVRPSRSQNKGLQAIIMMVVNFVVVVGIQWLVVVVIVVIVGVLALVVDFREFMMTSRLACVCVWGGGVVNWNPVMSMRSCLHLYLPHYQVYQVLSCCPNHLCHSSLWLESIVSEGFQDYMNGCRPENRFYRQRIQGRRKVRGEGGSLHQSALVRWQERRVDPWLLAPCTHYGYGSDIVQWRSW